MTERHSNPRQLAKNTAVLYARTFLVMVIGLITSRLILKALGIDNFGIYNVVGGFVGFFAIVSATLVSTTQRYINVEIGKGKAGNINTIFGTVFAIHIALAIVMILLFETIGLWYLNCKMVLPPERLYAANWVFQISVATSILALFSTPYQGLIVSYEKMKAFAYISLQDAFLRLGICYLLLNTQTDRLILYAFLVCCIQIWDQVLYVLYCKCKFKHIRIKRTTEWQLYREIFTFAGMNFIGSLSYILSTQGVNLVLNLFFGVVVNAARAISNQVLSLATRFTGDFMTAINPQITKEYAAGNIREAIMLCFRGAKFSYLIMLIPAVPITIRTPEILSTWLGDYPDFSISFIRITIAVTMIGILAQPFVTLLLASGNIKKTMLWVGGLRLLTLPLVYIAFLIGGSPDWAYWIVLIVDTAMFFIRIRFLDDITGIKFSGKFCFRTFPVLIAVSILTLTVSGLLDLAMPDTKWGLLCYIVASAVLTLLTVVFTGLNRTERFVAFSALRNKFHFT